MSTKKIINAEIQQNLQAKCKISKLLNLISSPLGHSPLVTQYGFRTPLLTIEDDLKEFCLIHGIKNRSDLNFETLFIGRLDDIQELVIRFFVRSIDVPEDKLNQIFLI